MDHSASSAMLREARPLVAHLYQRRPLVYWLDFLVSLIVGYACAGYYLWQPWHPWRSCVAFVVAGFCLYRASMFMHEVVHFRAGEMRLFTIVWNLIAGIPMLMPSFFYEVHREHHASHQYGTEHDGEYLPLVHGGWRTLAAYLAEILLLPIYFVVRFLVGTPLSLLFPSMREWLLERHSSFVIDMRHRRVISDEAPRRLWMLIELGCFLRVVVLIGLVVLGFASPWRLVKIYSLACFALGINHLRTLAAHRYENTGQQMSYHDQFLDSTNVEGNWLTELICPLGLRYHALHHLLPGLPYHHLGAAHRLLSQRLPADSVYHQVTYPSCWSVVTELVRNIRSSVGDGRAVAGDADRAA